VSSDDVDELLGLSLIEVKFSEDGSSSVKEGFVDGLAVRDLEVRIGLRSAGC